MLVLWLALLLLDRAEGLSASPLSWLRVGPPESATATTSSAWPPPRRGAALVYDPSTKHLVLFGGTGANGALADVWAYDIGTRVWQQISTFSSSEQPEPRHTFVYGLYLNDTQPAPVPPRRSLIVSTGQGAQVFSDTWALDLDTWAWRRLPDNGDAPPTLYGSAGGIVPLLPGRPGVPRLWLSHGFSLKTRYSKTWVYDLRAESWSVVHGSINSYDPMKPHARCIVSSTVTADEQIVMYGGCAQNGGTGGQCPARDTWRFDTPVAPGSGAWHQASSCPTPRTRGAMAPLASPAELRMTGGRYVMLYGGFETDKQTISVSAAPDDQLPVLDLDSGLWLMLRAGGQVPAFRAQAAVAHDLATGRVWVFGGQLRDGGAISADLYMLQGDPAVTPPHSVGCGSSMLFPYLHGLFMGLGWGVLLQAGWFIARYFKAHDPRWFHLHRACQITGLVLSIVGLALVMSGGVKANNLGFSHGAIGLTTMGLGLLQPINAFFRPHKGAKWRTQWEWLHLWSGRSAVLLGAANVSLGTFLLQGPAAVWIAWHSLLGCFVVACVVMEVRLQRALRLARTAPPTAAHEDGSDMDTTIGSSKAGGSGKWRRGSKEAELPRLVVGAGGAVAEPAGP
ncbi:hypothetical protein HYH03_010250 [Edaphochlamys debaryana]|uniref:Cytochrome b561 domain-containing protein n=1 Tax=Edaphochlamys debaryana TaxID=47281 RepID=A0A835Y2P2_9CHLO|nr:hypothetical protein HYH03_010250 [Edaphochlamys debaryana]|eukprot:KAG2491465.1 hypothetical protein HYH03_010250 [Edaphochlamys debaryana]